MFLVKAKIRQLTDKEKSMFATLPVSLSQPHLQNATVSIYYKLLINMTGRTVIAKESSRSILRDNSGLVYLNSHGICCYGQLHMVIVFDEDQSYATIIPLHQK